MQYNSVQLGSYALRPNAVPSGTVNIGSTNRNNLESAMFGNTRINKKKRYSRLTSKRGR
jgi:hypothetical protein